MASISNRRAPVPRRALGDAISFYEELSGFQCDFVYSGLLCERLSRRRGDPSEVRSRLEAERVHRKSMASRRTYLPVRIDELYGGARRPRAPA
jgi:hypothetical protein